MGVVLIVFNGGGNYSIMADLPAFKITEHSKCLHTVDVDCSDSHVSEFDVFHCSDIHFDSKHCKRETFLTHLEEAVERGAFICIYGDVFDLMGAKRDPRSVTGDIRPEYTRANYLDEVVQDVYEHLKPFVNNILLISAGNHETSIVKHKETDPLRRLVFMLNEHCEHNIIEGAYAGYIIWRSTNKGGSMASWVEHFHHGYGGNAKRSKGILNVDIDLKQAPSADLVIRGHIHQKWTKTETVERVETTKGIRIKPTKVLYLQLGSYKDDVTDVPHGWAKQKHFDTPEIGGYLTTFRYYRKRHGGKQESHKDIRIEDWDEFRFK